MKIQTDGLVTALFLSKSVPDATGYSSELTVEVRPTVDHTDRILLHGFCENTDVRVGDNVSITFDITRE